MDLRADVTVDHPLEDVFTAYRERLLEVVPLLPNVRAIRVISRAEEGDTVVFVNEWDGGGDIPKVVRGVLDESMLRWTDFATWHLREHSVTWRTEVHAFPGAVASAGKNHFVAVAGDPARTAVQIRGALTIDAAKVPGVPRLLAGTVASTAERLIVGQVQQNLVAVARGVDRLLRGG